MEVNEAAQDGNGDRSGYGVGTGTGTGVETCRRTQDGNGDRNGDGSEDSSGDGNGDEDSGNRNEDSIGEGGREAKTRKKLHKRCSHYVGKGETWVERGKMKKRKDGPVAANPDNLESNKEAGGGAQGTQG